MPAPIVGLAVGAAARFAAKKAASKTVSRIDRSKIVKGSDVAKAIKKVNAKTAKVEAKANARGLKAAQQPTRASKSNEIKMVNKLAEKHRAMGQKNPDAVRSAARFYDKVQGVQTRAAARNAAAKTTKSK
jgi:hypothetical protein